MAGRFVVDASVVVASLLPDEPYRDAALVVLTRFLTDDLELLTVPLLKYEAANALWRAVRAGRAQVDDAEEALKAFEDFNIPEKEVSAADALKLACQYDRSAYDSAYLALAQAERAPLITADRRLYNALKEKFSLLIWLEDLG